MPHITVFGLLDPKNFPRIHVHGHNGVGAAHVRFGEGIARRKVNGPPLGIERQRTPYAGARGAQKTPSRQGFSRAGRF